MVSGWGGTCRPLRSWRAPTPASRSCSAWVTQSVISTRLTHPEATAAVHNPSDPRARMKPADRGVAPDPARAHAPRLSLQHRRLDRRLSGEGVRGRRDDRQLEAQERDRHERAVPVHRGPRAEGDVGAAMDQQVGEAFGRLDAHRRVQVRLAVGEGGQQRRDDVLLDVNRDGHMEAAAAFVVRVRVACAVREIGDLRRQRREVTPRRGQDERAPLPAVQPVSELLAQRADRGGDGRAR